VVKEKIAQAPVERGWEPVGDPRAQAELKEKIKREDPKSVPPPSVQTSEKTVPPSASLSPATTPGPTRDKGKNKQRDNTEPNAALAPADATAPSVAPQLPKEKANKHRYETVAPPPPAPRVAPPMTPQSNPNRTDPDIKSEKAVEKPKHERPSDIKPKLREQATASPTP
jgi:hypothetical protein